MPAEKFVMSIFALKYVFFVYSSSILKYSSNKISSTLTKAVANISVGSVLAGSIF